MKKDECDGTRKRASTQETRESKHARKNKVVRTRKGTKNSNDRHKKGR